MIDQLRSMFVGRRVEVTSNHPENDVIQGICRAVHVLPRGISEFQLELDSGTQVGFNVRKVEGLAVEGFMPSTAVTCRRIEVAKPLVVFIAHPISGDVDENIKKVLGIMERMHSKNVVPIFPSYASRQYLTDSEAHQLLARAHIEVYFKRRLVDELWLYGDRITEGMWREIELARKYGVRVVPMTEGTQSELEAREGK